MSKQREALKLLIIRLCNKVRSRTFALQELHKEYGNYSQIGISGQSPDATIRRLLQELRDQDNFIYFDENRRGWYTLQQFDLLDYEKKDLNGLDISVHNDNPHKKEHLIEIYSRSARWVQEAKKTFGCYCLLDKCTNTFNKPNGKPYIEVHHIIPLHQGGEDGVWNLSVLCAHHHRMAHFAEEKTKLNIQENLLNITQKYT